MMTIRRSTRISAKVPQIVASHTVSGKPVLSPNKRRKLSGTHEVQQDIPSVTVSVSKAIAVSATVMRPRPSSSRASSPLSDPPEPDVQKELAAIAATTVEKKAARKKKIKEVAEAEPSDYPTRVDTPWKIGAHVSAAGGVENAILNAAKIGANAFALFLKSQRKWTSADLTDESIQKFKDRLKRFSYSPQHVLPHGNYLVNLGNPDAEKREKSYECFVDELKRCELLELPLLNFHPGSTVGIATKEESIAHVAACINRAHKETSTAIAVIECMAGSGNVLGSSFADLASMIEQVEDKSRVGICLDTCHMFAAGYDIRTRKTYNATMEEFDKIVGLKYLRGMHLNDSKAALASNKDRHENIGIGEIGLTSFAFMATDIRLKNIPLILETHDYDEPTTVWKTEIDVLNRLSKLASDEETTFDWSEEKGKLSELTSEVQKAVTIAQKAENERKKAKENKKRKRAKNDEDSDDSDE